LGTRRKPPANRIRHAAGCVAYRRDERGILLVLLIRDKQGRWTLPKGHLELGESEAEAALREVQEETGVGGELGAFIGRIAYPMRRRGVLQTKQVAFFLLAANTAELTPQVEEGITGIEWYPAADAPTRAGYDLVSGILAKALAMIPELRTAGA
jgi:8-oxo-dGTP diphosphatase